MDCAQFGVGCVDDLLFLVHRIPYPPNKGDKIRSYHLLQHLRRRYRVHLGCFIDDPEDEAHVSILRDSCADLMVLSLPPRRAKLASLRGLWQGTALTLPYYANAQMARWVNTKLEREAIRRVLVFSSSMAQYVDGSRPALRRVMDFVDVDSDKWRQYSENCSWPLRWIYRREARRLADYERQIAVEFDACLFVSDAEADLFRRLAPDALASIDYAHNGVDTEYFAPRTNYPNPYAADERVLVFTGAMDYWANVDAVSWFAEEVFDALHAAEPQARFYIVGSRPTEAVQRLARRPGIVVTGRVPDTRPYIAHARAAVAPLRIARGVQNKVLEAMAMEKPVLVSPQAMDGIAGCADLEQLVSESPSVMRRLAAELIAGDGYAALGKRARECVLAHYRWETNLARFDNHLEGANNARRADAARRRRSP